MKKKRQTKPFGDDFRVVLTELAGLFDLFSSSTLDIIRDKATTVILMRMNALVNEKAPLRRFSDAELLAWIDAVQGMAPKRENGEDSEAR